MPWWAVCNNALAIGICLMVLYAAFRKPVILARDHRIYEPFFAEMLEWSLILSAFNIL